jgi:hypothetical protein
MLLGSATRRLFSSAACTAGVAGFFYNSTRGNTYMFSTSSLNFSAAEQACKDNGGHLTSWAAQEEQAEVEQYYTSQGILLPAYHTFYWMGLNTSSWPNFTWLDRSLAPDYNSTYTHWGLSPTPEPNNRPNPPELCAGANISQAFSTLPNNSAWGWSDANCSLSYNFICKILREPPRPAGSGPASLSRLCWPCVPSQSPHRRSPALPQPPRSPPARSKSRPAFTCSAPT